MGITDPTRGLTPKEQRQLAQLLKQFQAKAEIFLRKSLIVYLPNGFFYAAEVKAYSPPIAPYFGKLIAPGAGFDLSTSGESGKDIAILKIEGKNFPTLALGDSDLVQLGEPIWVIGYPGAVLQHGYISKISAMLTPTVTQGTISGTKVDVKGMPVIQTDAQVTWGNSGGPAVNRKGEVVGVATFIGIVRGQAIQGFNVLVPINTVKEFIRASGVPLGEESLFNKFWYRAIDLYNQGRYEEALEALDRVQKIHPNFPDVLKLQQLIVELREKEGTPSLPTVWWISAGVAFLLVLTLLSVLYWRRRSVPVEISQPVGSTTPRPTVIPPQAKHPFGELLVESGPVKGQRFPVGEKGLVIGRDPRHADSSSKTSGFPAATPGSVLKGVWSSCAISTPPTAPFSTAPRSGSPRRP